MRHSSVFFALPTSQAIPLNLVSKVEAESWLKTQGPSTQNSASEKNWTGKLGQALIVTTNGCTNSVAVGIGDAESRSRQRFGMVAEIFTLPARVFELTTLNKDFAI